MTRNREHTTVGMRRRGQESGSPIPTWVESTDSELCKSLGHPQRRQDTAGRTIMLAPAPIGPLCSEGPFDQR